MKNITTRTFICLFLSLLLAAGTAVFVSRFFSRGDDWASFPSNKHMYTNGILNRGRVLDRNGIVLARYEDGWKYHSNSSIRLGTLHVTGNPKGTIKTGALSAFADEMTGYNFLTGADSILANGRDVYLTIDADLCAAGYEALKGRNGAICIYNYKTGEVLCMVSSPVYDPSKDPTGEKAVEGAFINNVVSAKFIPGSTFKLITLTAALETIPDIASKEFRCTGKTEVGGTVVTCPKAHGKMTLEEALNESCNGVFATLAYQMGSSTMKKYVKSTGLTASYSISGILSTPSTFDFSGDENLAWSGIGQGKDQMNPVSMLIFNGAIASGGRTAVPKLLHHTSMYEGTVTSLREASADQTSLLIEATTAETVKKMMRSNVTENYGQSNFPGLEICAKSGTAETAKNKTATAWFTGFLDDSSHPLAFTVMIEGGGSGATAAGTVASKLLQTAVKAGY